MSRRALAYGAALAILAAVVVGGCRWPEWAVLHKRQTGTIYDTAHEKLLNSGKAPPLLEQAWRDEIPVYAEPVAIRGWRDGISTWEVFFATNRAADPSTAGLPRERFGNETLNAPLYGRAEVTLPARRRGVDPKRANGGRRDEKSHLAEIDSVGQMASGEFLSGVARQVSQSRQKDVLIFVHGFNVDFEACLVRTAQIALDMPFNGAVVAYSWPSLSDVNGYREDESRNADSVAPFREFLTTLRDGLDDDVKLHIVVHSMGNRVVLAALSQMPRPEGKPPVDNLALFAPDVGLSRFREQAPAAAAQCRRVTLYASRHDGALILSKGLHGEQRAGDAHPPQVMEGIETVDCSAIDSTSFLGHSYYSANIDVLSDLFQLLKRDWPADKRPHLKEKGGPAGTYWKWTTNAPHDIWEWHFDHLAASEEPSRG